MSYPGSCTPTLYTSYTPTPLDLYFKPEVTLCPDQDTIHQLASETLQLAWTLNQTLVAGVRDSIGSYIVAGKWNGHPYFDRLQNTYNSLSTGATKAASCASNCITSAFQRGWGALRQGLQKEQVPHSLRKELSLNRADLGAFSDTALVVVDRPTCAYNEVSPKEFERISQVYSDIKEGNSALKLEGTEEFKTYILQSLRSILSTPTGREVFYALHIYAEPILILEGPKSAFQINPDTDTRKIIIDQNNHPLYFTSDGHYKIEGVGLPASIFFHESFHAFEHLIQSLPNEPRYKGDNIQADLEETRTIAKTNQFRKELGLPSRFGHQFFLSKSTEKKLIRLLSYGIRIDEGISVSDTIKAYESQILDNARTYVHSICRGGHLDLLVKVFEQYSGFTQESLNYLISSSIIGGQKEITALLLPKISSWKIDPLIAAIESKDPELVELILNKYTPFHLSRRLDENESKQLLETACKFGNVEVIQKMADLVRMELHRPIGTTSTQLNPLYFDSDFIETLITYGLEYRQLDALYELLRHLRTSLIKEIKVTPWAQLFDQYFKLKGPHALTTFMNAPFLKNIDTEIIQSYFQYIISNREKVEIKANIDSDLFDTLDLSFKLELIFDTFLNKQLEISKLLLNKIDLDNLSEEEYSLCVSKILNFTQYATLLNQLDYLQLFLEKIDLKKISTDQLVSLLEPLLRINQLPEVQKQLINHLKSEELTSTNWRNLLYYAMDSNIDFAQSILRSSKIILESSDIGMVFHQSIHSSDTRGLELILNSKYFSQIRLKDWPEAIDRALYKSLNEGYSEPLKLLLTNAPCWILAQVKEPIWEVTRILTSGYLILLGRRIR